MKKNIRGKKISCVFCQKSAQENEKVVVELKFTTKSYLSPTLPCKTCQKFILLNYQSSRYLNITLIKIVWKIS